MITVTRTNIRIEPKPERVIPLYLKIIDKTRIERIVSAVLSLDEKTVEETCNRVLSEFENRHIGFRQILLKNYASIKAYVPSHSEPSLSGKLLLGLYFTKEYSVEYTALFNPSIVIHPDQNGLKIGEVRFILSLRATGEGHISSIEFRTGIISRAGEITIDPYPSKLVGPNKNENSKYSKDFVKKRAKFYNDFNASVFDYLPEQFSIHEALQKIVGVTANNQNKLDSTKKALREIFDTNYDISFDEGIAISSRVIFPASKAEKTGLEDVRFVKFSDHDKTRYLGTYTAYDGRKIRSKIIETEDFISFRLRQLYGKAALDKGMAFFPEKINGKYALISRQGGESISLMYSDDLYYWDTYKIIQEPEREWELLQIGNCGSPVKTAYGWLLLTHAVGPLRKYVISATLLDLNNPEIVLATLDKPLIIPNTDEREGYVPNVVYSCGFLLHFEHLIIPYAISDSITSFARINIYSLVDKLLKK
jgi:predicted GH43/DUF377 family glycosyl hydrolase